MAYCGYCGKETRTGAYCSNCGKKTLRTRIYRRIIVLTVITILVAVIIETVALNTPIDNKSILGSMKRISYMTFGIEFCGNTHCASDELYVCRNDCRWCSDGTCQPEEIGSCYADCEWCGDGFCSINESCTSCPKDCGACNKESYCGDRICSPKKCKEGCMKDCSLLQCQNSVCEPEIGENCVVTPNDCSCGIDETCDPSGNKCIKIHCGNNICDAGETSLTCPNDCHEKYSEVLLDANKDLPIIFVHGHSPNDIEGYSPTELEEFQNKLVQGGYENKGYLLPSDYPPQLTEGVWSGKKVSVIMTYYTNKFDKLGGIVGPDDNQDIKVYAQRLSDVVEVLKHNTRKNKVIIISHSMGGLVSREYIKDYGGITSVDKLIMIGTPNHGTEAFTITALCGVLHSGPECAEMEVGSTFLINLNKDKETFTNIKYLTITGRNKKGTTCPNEEYWDNVICSSSVPLNGAENFYYDDFSDSYGTINGNTLHTTMTKPSKAPAVYNKIIAFIKQ